MLAAAARLFVRGVRGGLGRRVRAGAGRWVELPTYAFQRQRYWPRPAAAAGGGCRWRARTARRRGSGRRWTGGRGRGGRAVVPVAGAVTLEPLAGCCRCCRGWRQRQREQAVLDGWRYRVSWQPVADPEPGALAGRWLLVVPAGLAGAGLAGSCARLLADGGAEVVTVRGGCRPGWTGRCWRAGSARPWLAGMAAVRVWSRVWCRCWRLARRGRGLAGDAGCWCRRWGMPGWAGRLWVLTSGAVAAGAGEVPVRCRRRCGGWAGWRRWSIRSGGAG